MNKDTLEALEDAIDHWKNDFGHEMNSFNCALCQLFHSSCHAYDGEKCPVFLHTGEKSCEGTPWQPWPSSEERGEMIAFLKSLRPGGKEKEIASKEKEIAS